MGVVSVYPRTAVLREANCDTTFCPAMMMQGRVFLRASSALQEECLHFASQHCLSGPGESSVGLGRSATQPIPSISSLLKKGAFCIRRRADDYSIIDSTLQFSQEQGNPGAITRIYVSATAGAKRQAGLFLFGLRTGGGQPGPRETYSVEARRRGRQLAKKGSRDVGGRNLDTKTGSVWLQSHLYRLSKSLSVGKGGSHSAPKADWLPQRWVWPGSHIVVRCLSSSTVREVGRPRDWLPLTWTGWWWWPSIARRRRDLMSLELFGHGQPERTRRRTFRHTAVTNSCLMAFSEGTRLPG